MSFPVRLFWKTGAGACCGLQMLADILQFPRPVPTDGGETRIRAGRELIGLGKQGEPTVEPDSLVMLRADETLSLCDCA